MLHELKRVSRCDGTAQASRPGTVIELAAGGRALELALFSAGSITSRRFVPPAVRTGTVVIDNSSAFRMDGEVPLVVPEVLAKLIGTPFHNTLCLPSLIRLI